LFLPAPQPAQSPLSALLQQILQGNGANFPGGFQPGGPVGSYGSNLGQGNVTRPLPGQGPGIHYFGPGGAGVGYPQPQPQPQGGAGFPGEFMPADPSGPAQVFPQPQPLGGGHFRGQLQGAPGDPQQFRPADLLHAAGHDQAASAVYLQHHPGFMQGTARNVPGYVGKGAVGAVQHATQGVGGQSSRNILDQLAHARAVAQTMQHLRRLRPATRPNDPSTGY